MFILLDIIDMNNMNNDSIPIPLNVNLDNQYISDIQFNTKNQLILYNETTIWTYSTHGKLLDRENLPKGYKLISVSKYGKRYLLLDNYIYEWSDVKIPAKRIFACQKRDVI